MDLFRSVLGGGVSGAGAGPSSAETIERLVDRLDNSTLLEDRRDACRALKAMSRKFRVEVGAQALDVLLSVLSRDLGVDEEILGYALEALANICSPDEFDEEHEDETRQHERHMYSMGEQFTEIFLKKTENVQLVIDLLEEFDFKIRRPAIKLLTNLLLNKHREMQEIVLASQMGVSRLMDVLADTREVMRNDTLLLLIQLTKGNANLQKIVAFENCFDKLTDIVSCEGYSDGGIVVEDCLRLMLNLMRNNHSNQTFFREGSYIQRVAPFFDLSLDEEEIEVGWSAQKVSNMMHMLMVIRTLVAPSNPTHVTASCQSTIMSCGLLEKLCSILLAAGIPADILTESINTISEVIRGCTSNQQFFHRVQAPCAPPRPALILLLMSMVNEKQPFALRCAVLYCFQCFLHKNPGGKHEIMSTLLPSNKPTDTMDMTAGQLLCAGLFSHDRLSNWFSAVAMSHGLKDQEPIKQELLRVQLSTAGGNEPVALLTQCNMILQQTQYIQTRLGMLMLISTWVSNCPTAVSSFLSISNVVPFLTGQIGSNEHDEMERLGQGLCAFVLGLCLIYNDNSVNGHSQEQLYQLIEKRIGWEVFLDKLSEVSKHEAYNKALKQPQLKTSESKELIFDHTFCLHFKHSEHLILNHVNKQRSEMNSDPSVDTDPLIVKKYKEVIREQDAKITERDHRIGEITKANLYLQQELKSAKQQIDELNNAIETLKDLNALLKAQTEDGGAGADEMIKLKINENHAAAATTNHHENGNMYELLAQEKIKFEKELKIRDEIIHELEMRLAAIPPAEKIVFPPTFQNGPTQIEMNMMQSQMEALRLALSEKEQAISLLETKVNDGNAEKERLINLETALETTKSELNSLRSEHEDLLMMLADNEK